MTEAKDDPKPDPVKLLEDYFRMMTHNGVSRIYRTSRELGLFDALDSSESTLEELCEACGLHRMPLNLLLDALVEAGLVVRRGEAYAPAPVMAMLRGNYRELGDPYWDHLETWLKTGTPYIQLRDKDQSEAFYQQQTMELGQMLRPSAAAVAQLLGAGLGKGPEILDIGAGSGVWSSSFAMFDKQARTTCLDWPAVLPVAQKFAAELGVRDRQTLLPGDLHEVEFESRAYDLIYIANVTHLLDEAGNTRLFKRARAALKPGGELVIVDVFSRNREAALKGALYALGLALRTTQGQVHTAEAMIRMLKDSGFDDAQFQPIEVTPGVMGMVRARKSADCEASQ